MTRTRLAVVLPLLLLSQLVLVAVGVWPQLSARATGDEIQLRVRPRDPIDPFRGAYVTLNYPDLRVSGSHDANGGMGSLEDGESGPVYLILRQEGDLWVTDDWSRERPASGLYLSCADRTWQVECGIESWFLPQDEARAMERDLAAGTLIATVKVDGRGNAALVDVTP